ncbi:hypothetical protein [Sinorhizobium sp. BG8]|uniref:hypothetical protein n=1 Tax=Sinorhizobium sp. BG8 TaxID=2613773 RepID=UPI00193E8AD1|nr:hypothetical protein [Sinorhizobium sp. BG8]QRM54845.1 hypothetical protein F3Y30_10035 [Sinorhizobium sp. BG8]
MFINEDKRNSWHSQEKRDDLAEQYKPVGLRAVLAAASQRKPDRESDGNERDIPPGLQDCYS